MVVKIESAATTSASALGYNMGKVVEGVADVIAVENIPDGWTPEEVFGELEGKSPQIRKPSFHMSISPGPADAHLDSEQAAEFAKELMAEMGYGDRPVLVFRHHDIEREHFHVVSTRIGADGLKVSDSNERVRLQNAMRKLSKKYGFEIGAGTSKDRKAELLAEFATTDGVSSKKSLSEAKKEGRYYRPAFVQGNGSVTSQVRSLVTEAMTYSFSSEAQFIALMQTFRVFAEKDENGNYMFRGMNGDGKPVTAGIPSSQVFSNLPEVLAEKVKDRTGYTEKNKERCRKTAVALLDKSRGYEHYQRLMASKGIDVVYSRSEDNTIFGVTFIDHATKNIWKGSELERTLLTAKGLQKRIADGLWSPDKPKKKTVKGKVRPATLYSWRRVASPSKEEWEKIKAEAEIPEPVPPDLLKEPSTKLKPKDKDKTVMRRKKSKPTGPGILDQAPKRTAAVLGSLAQGSGHNDEHEGGPSPDDELEEEQRRLKERGL